MKQTTSLQSLNSAINYHKNKLALKSKTKGLTENFGQNIVQKLYNQYIDSSNYSKEMNLMRRMLNNFNEWCMTFSLK